MNSLVIYRQNVDHLKFRIDFVEGLLVKYSVHHGVSGHHDGDNTLKKLTECHLPRGIPPTDKKCKPTRRCVGCIRHEGGKERERERERERNCICISRL